MTNSRIGKLARRRSFAAVAAAAVLAVAATAVGIAGTGTAAAGTGNYGFTCTLFGQFAPEQPFSLTGTVDQTTVAPGGDIHINGLEWADPSSPGYHIWVTIGGEKIDLGLVANQLPRTGWCTRSPSTRQFRHRARREHLTSSRRS